jgi:hypothetical protein
VAAPELPRAGHRPNGVATRLALATRPSGPVSVAQPRPKWPGHPAWRAHRLWSPRGGHARGDAVVRPTSMGNGLNAVRSPVGAPAARGGSAGQGGRSGDSPSSLGVDEAVGGSGAAAFLHSGGASVVACLSCVALQLKRWRGR